MKKIITLSGVVLASTMLYGCVGMNSQFNCPVRAHGRCVPLDQVNQAATRGAFNGAGTTAVSPTHFLEKKTPSSYPHLMTSGRPIRYGETVQRIWIAPYQDSADTYHEPSVVYTVVTPAHWIDRPVKSVRDT